VAVEAAGTMPVAVVEPLGRVLAAASADHAVDVGLHQELQHDLGGGTQEVAVVGLLQQLDPCHSLLGHRGLRRSAILGRSARWPPRPAPVEAGVNER